MNLINKYLKENKKQKFLKNKAINFNKKEIKVLNNSKKH